jgi:hypothetical protein
MRIGPRFDPRRVQRNRVDAATGAAIGRRGFLGITVTVTARAATRAGAVWADARADELRLRATYGDNDRRQVQWKNRVDPANLFALNATIRPA